VPGDEVPGRRDSLYGRRKGKPLSPRRAGLMATEFPKLAIDTAISRPADLTCLFAGAPSRIRLEIGFGGGEHLIAAARRAPDVGFIGIEPFLNGTAKAVAAIVEGGLHNVRLYSGEASVLIDWMPEKSLETVDILYPDPWPKKRHWKRRFISNENLDRLARVLKPRGLVRFASDIPSYVAWTLALVSQRRDLEWTAEKADDWLNPFGDWPGTRYEAKALKAGRTPTYLTFRRASNVHSP
jgi:tRNA (guanine-N7-)-methyltransferase